MPDVTRFIDTHNPEVAGSNPARATREVAGRWPRGGPHTSGAARFCVQFAPKFSGPGLPKVGPDGRLQSGATSCLLASNSLRWTRLGDIRWHPRFLKIDGAPIVEPDIATSNAIIHAIDGVLTVLCLQIGSGDPQCADLLEG